MIMKRKIFIFGVILFSCTDNEHTTLVSGIVRNYGSKEPIDSVRVELKDGVGASGFSVLPASTDKKNIAYTDSEGRFDLELSGEYTAFISIGKAGYEFTNIEIKPYSPGEHVNQILEMYAYTLFHPVLVSREPSFPDDQIKFEFISPALYKGYHVYDLTWVNSFSDTFEGIGPHQRERSFDYSIGDTYQPYRISLTREGETRVFLDSVYVKSFETYRDTIYY